MSWDNEDHLFFIRNITNGIVGYLTKWGEDLSGVEVEPLKGKSEMYFKSYAQSVSAGFKEEWLITAKSCLEKLSTIRKKINTLEKQADSKELKSEELKALEEETYAVYYQAHPLLYPGQKKRKKIFVYRRGCFIASELQWLGLKVLIKNRDNDEIVNWLIGDSDLSMPDNGLIELNSKLDYTQQSYVNTVHEAIELLLSTKDGEFVNKAAVQRLSENHRWKKHSNYQGFLGCIIHLISEGRIENCPALKKILLSMAKKLPQESNEYIQLNFLSCFNENGIKNDVANALCAMLINTNLFSDYCYNALSKKNCLPKALLGNFKQLRFYERQLLEGSGEKENLDTKIANIKVVTSYLLHKLVSLYMSGYAQPEGGYIDYISRNLILELLAELFNSDILLTPADYVNILKFALLVKRELPLDDANLIQLIRSKSQITDTNVVSKEIAVYTPELLPILEKIVPAFTKLSDKRIAAEEIANIFSSILNSTITSSQILQSKKLLASRGYSSFSSFMKYVCPRELIIKPTEEISKAAIDEKIRCVIKEVEPLFYQFKRRKSLEVLEDLLQPFTNLEPAQLHLVAKMIIIESNLGAIYNALKKLENFKVSKEEICSRRHLFWGGPIPGEFRYYLTQYFQSTFNVIGEALNFLELSQQIDNIYYEGIQLNSEEPFLPVPSILNRWFNNEFNTYRKLTILSFIKKKEEYLQRVKNNINSEPNEIINRPRNGSGFYEVVTEMLAPQIVPALKNVKEQFFSYYFEFELIDKKLDIDNKVLLELGKLCNKKERAQLALIILNSLSENPQVDFKLYPELAQKVASYKKSSAKPLDFSREDEREFIQVWWQKRAQKLPACYNNSSAKPLAFNIQGSQKDLQEWLPRISNWYQQPSNKELLDQAIQVYEEKIDEGRCKAIKEEISKQYHSRHIGLHHPYDKRFKSTENLEKAIQAVELAFMPKANPENAPSTSVLNVISTIKVATDTGRCIIL